MHPFTQSPAASVGAFGEEKLIREIRRWLGNVSPRAPFGIGDDCAVLPAAPGVQLITVDPVIFGRHFDARVPPRAVGAKLLKRNLSDLAAMGGRPVAAVLALTLDATVDRRWLEGFYRGLAAMARRHRVPVVGGDIAQADGVLAASLTLLGRASGPRVLTRRGARIGDRLFVTGVLGRSRSSGHHHSFSPRLEEGAWLAGQSDVRAMMDLSDGLAKDVHALTPAGAEVALDPECIPCRRGASLRSALTEGEDYELLVAIAADARLDAFRQRWQRKFPRVPFTPIGTFVRRGSAAPGALALSRYHGYEHLRASDPPGKVARRRSPRAKSPS